jgi:hypothetical protein
MTINVDVEVTTFGDVGAAFRRPATAWRLWACVFVCALGVGSVSGCTKARAQTVPDGPPLAMPAPPARVVTPPDEPQIASAPPIEAPALSAAPPRTPPSARAAGTQPPAAAVEPPRASRPTATDVVEERKVRDLLRRAANDINRVNRGRLNADGRAQYDQSKRLAEQAEQAVKERNWIFAGTLADKAATLAAELLTR